MTFEGQLSQALNGIEINERHRSTRTVRLRSITLILPLILLTLPLTLIPTLCGHTSGVPVGDHMPSAPGGGGVWDRVRVRVRVRVRARASPKGEGLLGFGTPGGGGVWRPFTLTLSLALALTLTLILALTRCVAPRIWSCASPG